MVTLNRSEARVINHRFLNWIAPQSPGGYRAAETVLEGLEIKPENLTKDGGSWMPVLEPINKTVPTIKY